MSLLSPVALNFSAPRASYKSRLRFEYPFSNKLLIVIQALGIAQGIPVHDRSAMDYVCDSAFNLLHVRGVGNIRYRNDSCRDMSWGSFLTEISLDFVL